MSHLPNFFALCSLLLAATDEAKVDYEKHVRPILATHCYQCHGPDTQEAGLRLDHRKAALAGGDSGQSIVAGKPESSPLLDRVAGKDEDLLMPPEGDRLTSEQVSILRRWIEQGAVWPEKADDPAAGKVVSKHWSYQPLADVQPPPISNPWIRNPIDAFILAKLMEQKIRPSVEADRQTLLRRLCLDLLGLPPSPEQVEAFLTDDRPDAYERLVDRLLAEPAFGERWGRYWLDLARYADSDGYEKDSPRPYAWRYRDWVINAFNDDLPFDQFTIEQLAGDLLPNPTLEQLVATGFHRNTLTNKEGGVDQEEFRSKAVVDRVNTTGTVWLGATLACCECHSHKYDPFSQREYYSFYAFFNSADERDIPAPLPAEQERYEQQKREFDKQHRVYTKAVDEFEKHELPGRLAAWEKEFQFTAVDWQVLTVKDARSEQGATLHVLEDGAIQASGKTPDEDVYRIVLAGLPKSTTALRLEALADSALPSSGPGRTPHGNFVLTHLTATAVNQAGKKTQLALTNPSTDYSQKNFDVAKSLDPSDKTGWAVSGALGATHVAVYELAKPSGDDAETLELVLWQQYGGGHTLGKLRISATTSAPPVREQSQLQRIAEVIAIPRDKRTAGQQATLVAFYRKLDPQLRKLDEAVTAHAKTAPAPPDTKAQTLFRRAEPRNTYVHLRGDFLQKGPQVQADTPAVLPPLGQSDEPPRLRLARWIVAPDNPLTPRVAANRVWQQLFGKGIVITDSDFGNQGQPPSHPELLDWLAREYLRLGWSRKALIKRIVCSATYRQSSNHRPELVEMDPKNVLLARQNRFRLPAETIRDIHLQASGLLVHKIGGPSIRPPLPADVAALGYANSVKWTTSSGGDKYRRGMYIFFQRTVPYPMLMTFDAPDSNVTCTRRETSNTPLQALTLLNDPVFFECAQNLGRRVHQFDADRVDKLRRLFTLCLARQPDDDELKRLQMLCDHVSVLCHQSPAEAKRLVAGIERQSGQDLELATWVVVARTVMNLDEFVTRE